MDQGGKILNLLSNDGFRIEGAFIFYHYLLIAPLLTITTAILLTKMVDLSILSGLLLLLIIVPLQSILGKVLTIYKYLDFFLLSSFLTH